ncbi:MAG: hypothetical protein J2P54_00185 [Bradyrhizobiaceae bacterium]|nr:hypothetical protein [Bradyrhizobiaceae bacterium]
MIGLRLSQEMRRQIEAWGAVQNPPLSFSEAVRRLLGEALKATKPRRTDRKEK